MDAITITGLAGMSTNVTVLPKGTRESNTWNYIDDGPLGLQRFTWLASYPRSGNTYFRICYERLFQLRSFAIYRTHENCCFPYDMRGDEPHVLVKTHRSETVNAWPAILIVRDGRAALASHAHFSVDDTPYETRLRKLVEDKAWSTMNAHWLDWPNVQVIRFEDLVTNAIEVIKKAIPWQQLGLSCVYQQATTFVELNRQAPGFFRGGNWKDDFTPELLDLFWKNHGEMMSRLGYADTPPS